MGKTIKIASLNVRGINQQNKCKEMFNYFRKKELDVICIQESHSTAKEQRLWDLQWGGNTIYSHGESNARGVMILSKKEIKLTPLFNDPDGRILICKIEYNDAVYHIANIYAPNDDRPDFYKCLFEKICNLEIVDIIVMGDFNLVIDPSVDKIDPHEYHSKAAQVIRNTLEEGDMVDIWRIRNPESRTLGP